MNFVNELCDDWLPFAVDNCCSALDQSLKKLSFMPDKSIDINEFAEEDEEPLSSQLETYARFQMKVRRTNVVSKIVSPMNYLAAPRSVGFHKGPAS